jgi:hypothetical protein
MDMSDEEVAYKLVELYVRDISQRGEKRQMGIDSIINAYFYALARVKNKTDELGLMEPAVEKHEEALSDSLEEIKFPSSSEDFNPFDFLG